jgi:hypothetical protein
MGLGEGDVSPLADFSFDYQDLLRKSVENKPQPE